MTTNERTSDRDGALIDDNSRSKRRKDAAGREVFRERERQSHRQTALIDDGKITKEKSGER